jgi:NAD(P)-dependent dehydrogenase (short-subunit alcohol dehydrogenase family)
MKTLKRQIAVVAGATRGAGRGIARALGEAGATVYCTGRSIRGKPSPYARPETIEETAELVSAAGGTGIFVRVDHTIETEVERLFQRVGAKHHRLDILVNCVAGEDATFTCWNHSLCEVEVDQGLALMRQAVFSHLLAAKHAVPLMMRRRRGLIIEVTDRDTLVYQGYGVMHDLVKATIVRLAFIMAAELRQHRIAALAVTPGYLRSESMLQHFGVTEENWRDAGKKDPNFLESETPLFVGRCIAALAADPKVLERSGDAIGAWELGKEYCIADADGRRPNVVKIFQSSPALQKNFRHELQWLHRFERRARRYAGQLTTESQRPPSKIK